MFSYRNQPMISSANQLTGFYMKATFVFNELMFHFLKSNFRWYHTKLYSDEKLEYYILFNIIFKKWEKNIFLLYISSSLKKRLAHAYGLTLMSLFIKIMMRNYESCPVITPKSIFIEVVITGHHFWRYGAVLPETNFTFWNFITCLSLLPKQISQYLRKWYWF